MHRGYTGGPDGCKTRLTCRKCLQFMWALFNEDVLCGTRVSNVLLVELLERSPEKTGSNPISYRIPVVH